MTAPAVLLRAAADRMRELAGAATDWNADIVPGDSLHLWVTDYDPSDPTGQTPMQRAVGGADAPWSDYIAAMHPAVALAVADWLETVDNAPRTDDIATRLLDPVRQAALTVARTFLGET